MTTPRGFRDRSEDSLFTLVGEVPELVRNLVVAEVDSAKAWVRRTSKDAGIGAGWIVAALFFLFWSIAALGAFVIIGLSSWWPAWLSALVVFVALVLVAVLLALLGILRFRRVARSQNPVQSVVHDVKEVRDEL
ncbi:phage holin family protein [Microbacterium terregens]|uniref:Phage holin family protein n=1 Tax=Microbacterium terregens TaxID=69363 RepID=A0ABV5SVB8_9MICO